MRNLLGRLLQRTPADLERIARAWSVELRGHDRHGDVSLLYRVMTDVWAVRDVWERLSPSGKALVRALEAHGGAACTPEQLAQEAGLDPEAARTELRTLHAIGILASEERGDPDAGGTVGVFLPREMGMMIERVEGERAAVMPRDLSLDDLLATVPFPELEEAASVWGARVIPAMHARGELVTLLRDQLSRPERVERMVADLSDPARNAWARLKAAGGVVALDDLLDPAHVPLSVRRRILRELAAPLLLWHGYDGERRLAVVPQAILNPAPVAVEPPPDLRVVPGDDVVEPEWLFPYTATWDLLTVVRDVAGNPPRWRPLAEGDPAIVRRLRRKLWRTDRESLDIPTGYLPFLVRLGATIGVLREDDERAVPGDAAAAWREQAFTTASQRLVAAWTAAEDWIEGRERVDANLYGAAWPAFREALLRALGELDEDHWYDQARFIERLLRVQPNVLRQAQVAAVGVTRRAALDPAADAHERRGRVLALVIGTTLETACVWLGLVERSYERESEEPVLRVTPFGRWIAGKRVEPSLPQLGQTPLAVGANFQILLYRPTPRRVWALSAFAEVQSLDRVSTYTLSAESLIRALASGIDLDQITNFLERQNGAPLPQNVAYTLAEWDRGYRRVWLRRAVVLVPEEGEKSEPVVAALRDAGLDPELLPDGRITLIYDDPDAGERLYIAAHRALRERGFAPLADPQALASRRRR
jgi:predicted transcriptional regulator